MKNIFTYQLINLSLLSKISVVGKVPEAEGETFDSDVLAKPSMRERQLLRRKNTR
jgi:hypothetical protein